MGDIDKTKQQEGYLFDGGNNNTSSRLDNYDGFNVVYNFNTEDVTINTNTTGFDLLGNPYAAHLDAGTFLGAATSSNLDQSQLWVWNQASGMYDVETSLSGFMLAPAQGFFVSVNTAGSVTFAESNQLTTGGTFQKNSTAALKILKTGVL